jgi:dUTP pyrophosphatase
LPPLTIPALTIPALTILVQRLLPAAQLPRYAHTGPFGDLAADLFAAEAATLAPAGEPGCTQAIRTGLALELPSTHGALVEDRSGLALRGITTLAGVIDPGYRGELKIVLSNLSAEPHIVAPGHRIAQLRIVERIQASFEETDTLAQIPETQTPERQTARNTAGFGSTGF